MANLSAKSFSPRSVSSRRAPRSYFALTMSESFFSSGRCQLNARQSHENLARDSHIVIWLGTFSNSHISLDKGSYWERENNFTTREVFGVNNFSENLDRGMKRKKRNRDEARILGTRNIKCINLEEMGHCVVKENECLQKNWWGQWSYGLIIFRHRKRILAYPVAAVIIFIINIVWPRSKSLDWHLNQLKFEYLVFVSRWGCFNCKVMVCGWKEYYFPFS